MRRMKRAYHNTELEDNILDWAYENIIERNFGDLDDAIMGGIDNFASDASSSDMEDILPSYVDMYDTVWHDIFLDDSYYVDQWVSDLRDELEWNYDVPDGYDTLEDYLNEAPSDDREARRRRAMRVRRRAMMARRRNRRR